MIGLLSSHFLTYTSLPPTECWYRDAHLTPISAWQRSSSVGDQSRSEVSIGCCFFALESVVLPPIGNRLKSQGLHCYGVVKGRSWEKKKYTSSFFLSAAKEMSISSASIIDCPFLHPKQELTLPPSQNAIFCHPRVSSFFSRDKCWSYPIGKGSLWHSPRNGRVTKPAIW